MKRKLKHLLVAATLIGLVPGTLWSDSRDCIVIPRDKDTVIICPDPPDPPDPPQTRDNWT